MIRTQIYLPKQTYDDVKRLASKAGMPASRMVRDLIRRGLEVKRDNTKSRRGLMELANLGIKGGPKDLSAKADDYLYGER